MPVTLPEPPTPGLPDPPEPVSVLPMAPVHDAMSPRTADANRGGRRRENMRGLQARDEAPRDGSSRCQFHHSRLAIPPATESPHLLLVRDSDCHFCTVDRGRNENAPSTSLGRCADRPTPRGDDGAAAE